MDAPMMLDAGTLKFICQWFALCENGTLKAAPHPTLEWVPCCERCAKRAGLTDALVDIEMGGSSDGFEDPADPHADAFHGFDD